MTTDPTRCGSRIAITDGQARGDSCCPQNPGHDDDHGAPGSPLRWPRLDQHDGTPLHPQVTAS